MSGQSWNSSNNGGPSSSGGVQGYTPVGSPAAGAPARLNGEILTGTSSNGAPVPGVYHPSPTAQFVYSVPIVVLSPAAMAELFGGSAALYRGTAGFASGYASGLATGHDTSTALQLGLINFGVSAVNPFGAVPFMTPLVQASFNTGLTSVASQWGTNGNVNLGVAITAGVMRAGFGFATGNSAPESVGSALSTGSANGFFTSSIRIQASW